MGRANADGDAFDPAQTLSHRTERRIAWYEDVDGASAHLADECTGVDLDDPEAGARDGRVAEEVAEVPRTPPYGPCVATV